jgi:hypothetical protein
MMKVECIEHVVQQSFVIKVNWETPVIYSIDWRLLHMLWRKSLPKLMKELCRCLKLELSCIPLVNIRGWWRSIAILRISCMVSGQRTGAYFSDLDQTQSLWFPRIPIQDLALKRLSISSGLIVRTHIVGMVFGAPFSCSAQYWARESFS